MQTHFQVNYLDHNIQTGFSLLAEREGKMEYTYTETMLNIYSPYLLIRSLPPRFPGTLRFLQ